MTDIAQIAADKELLKFSGFTTIKSLAAALPDDVKRALLCDDKSAPIPDSLWHGKFSILREYVPGSACMWRYNKLGLVVRQILQEQKS